MYTKLGGEPPSVIFLVSYSGFIFVVLDSCFYISGFIIPVFYSRFMFLVLDYWFSIPGFIFQVFIPGFIFQAGGTGLLRLGESKDRTQGNSAGPPAVPAL